MSAPRSARGARRGWGLWELCIGMACAGIALLLGMAGVEAGGEFLSFDRFQLATEAEAQRALQRMVRELTSSGRSVMVPRASGDYGAERLDFRRAQGLREGEMHWGALQRLVLEYDPGEYNDGLDNDEDGVADEGRLVLVRNVGKAEEERIVLCHDVREFLEGETFDGQDDNGNGVVDERGFNLHWADGVLWVRLTIERANRFGKVALVTVESAVDVRNP